MLLENFNKEQSLAFIKLVEDFEYADKKISLSEKKILEKYLTKLSLTKEDKKKITIEEAVNTIVNSEINVRKLTYFELLRVALIDGEYETAEVNYLDDLAIKFGITRADKIAFANFYYNFHQVKKISEEEKNKRISQLIK